MVIGQSENNVLTIHEERLRKKFLKRYKKATKTKNVEKVKKLIRKYPWYFKGTVSFRDVDIDDIDSISKVGGKTCLLSKEHTKFLPPLTQINLKNGEKIFVQKRLIEVLISLFD